MGPLAALLRPTRLLAVGALSTVTLAGCWAPGGPGPGCIDPTEPNDSVEQAPAYAWPGVTNGALCTEDDQDFGAFVFPTLEAAQSYELKLTCSAPVQLEAPGTTVPGESCTPTEPDVGVVNVPAGVSGVSVPIVITAGSDPFVPTSWTMTISPVTDPS